MTQESFISTSERVEAARRITAQAQLLAVEWASLMGVTGMDAARRCEEIASELAELLSEADDKSTVLWLFVHNATTK